MTDQLDPGWEMWPRLGGRSLPGPAHRWPHSLDDQRYRRSLAALVAADEATHASDGIPRERLRALIADTAPRFAHAGLGPDREGCYVDPTAELYDDAGLPR